MNMEWPSATARACSRGRLCRSRLAASAKRFPLLPVEEEGRLNDLPLRENFVERVGVYPELVEGPTTGGHRCWRRNPRFRRADDLDVAAKRQVAWSLSLRSGQASSTRPTS